MLFIPWSSSIPLWRWLWQILALRGTDWTRSPDAFYEVIYTCPKHMCMNRVLAGDTEKKDQWRRTHSAAVKIWLELVQMAFIGLSCPFISPMGAKVSTFQSLRVPPLQPLSRTGTPGTRPRAQTQSLWALGTCWNREGKVSQSCKKFQRNKHTSGKIPRCKPDSCPASVLLHGSSAPLEQGEC